MITGTLNLIPKLEWRGVEVIDIYLECDTLSAPVKINLFETSEISRQWGTRFIITDATNNASVNNIIINTGGSDTFDGNSLQTLSIVENGGSIVVEIVGEGLWKSSNASGTPPVDTNTWDWTTAAFVSPSTGTAGGVVGNGNKPFQTFAQAQSASNFVVLLPGNYFGTQTLANNVHYHALAGVTLSGLYRDGGVPINIRFTGFAIMGVNSNGFETTAASTFDIECLEFDNVRKVAFCLGASGFISIKCKEIFCNGNNGAAYATSTRSGSTLIVECDKWRSYYWVNAPVGSSNSFTLRCSDVEILVGGVFGTSIAKSIINLNSITTENNIVVDFQGGTYTNNNPQSSSFGVLDSALLLTAYSPIGLGDVVKFQNGSVYCPTIIGLNSYYQQLDGSIELININIKTNVKALQLYQGATAAAGFTTNIFRNCNFEEELASELGNGHKGYFFNCTFKTKGEGEQANFEFNNQNPTTLPEYYFYNCNAQLDVGSGEFLKSFSTATIGLVNTNTSEVLGAGATDIWGGHTTVPTLLIPNQ